METTITIPRCTDEKADTEMESGFKARQCLESGCLITWCSAASGGIVT